MQLWCVIEGVCKTDGAEGYPVYGVQVTLDDGSVWSWEDVDVDRRVVERLACRLQTILPDACHWQDMVLDFIEEMATKV